jgi:hypothetical protein
LDVAVFKKTKKGGMQGKPVAATKYYQQSKGKKSGGSQNK